MSYNLHIRYSLTNSTITFILILHAKYGLHDVETVIMYCCCKNELCHFMQLPEIEAIMSRLFSCNMTSFVGNGGTGSDKLAALHTNPCSALWEGQSFTGRILWWCCDADALFVQVL